MKFVCPNCQQRFDAPEHWAGRTIRCTRCEEPIVVPSSSEDTVSSPPADKPLASPASKAATPPSPPEAVKPLSDAAAPTSPPREPSTPPPARDVVPTPPRDATTPPRDTPPPPPPRKSPSSPTDAAPLPPPRPAGTPDFVKMAFYILLLAAGIFEYTAFKHEESPQKTWRRFANVFGGSPESTPLPSPSPTATPAPPPALAQKPATTPPTPAPTASPAATPTPSPDLIAWLLAHRNRWPKEVTLSQPQDFPAVFEGKVVGAVTLPAGAVVTLVEVAPREIGVVSPGGSGKKLPPEATNLFELVQAEMQRPEPTPAPTPPPAVVAAPPTPTPAPAVMSPPTATSTPTPTPSSKPAKSYFGEAVDANDNSEPPSGPPADRTLTFDTTAPGVTKSIKTWGMGTVGGPGVVQSGLDNMGPDHVNVIIMPFPVKDPLTEKGELSAASKALIDADLATAKVAGNKPLIVSAGVGGPDPIDPWYLLGPNRVNTTRWAQCIVATMNYINRPIAWVQVFNEPDYAPWGEGSQKDLNDILGRLRGESAFRSTQLAGPAVLNVDWGLDWYNAIKGRVSIGTTHALNGSCASYINFLTAVKNNGQTSFCPELHNVGEAIIGAEYGLGGGIWWLGCGKERGDFVKASGGKRLAYAEDREKWSAAAVYRAPGGAIQAFLGTSERNAKTTTFRFVCQDREVYFDGKGPSKGCDVTIEPGKEQVINITWSH